MFQKLEAASSLFRASRVDLVVLCLRVGRDDVGRGAGEVEADGGVGLVAELLLALLDVAAVRHLHLDDVLDLLELLLLRMKEEPS